MVKKDESARIELKAARELRVSVVDGGGEPVEGASLEAYGNLMVVGTATTEKSGEAVVRIPADVELDAIIAAKGGVGMDYVLFWKRDQTPTDPYRKEQSFEGPVSLVLNGASSVVVTAEDEHGQPLAGARVSPWFFEKPHHGDKVNVGHRMFSRMTDEHGRAVMDALPGDNVQPLDIWVRKTGYTALGRTRFVPTKPAEVLRARLAKQISLRGRVVDAAGNPVEGAAICIGGGGGRIESFHPRPLRTAADGSFSVELDPDLYYVAFARKNDAVSPLWRRIVPVGDTLPPVELQLEKGMHVSGVVTMGADRRAVGHQQVSLTRYDDSYQDQATEAVHLDTGSGFRTRVAVPCTINATTDSEGRYSLFVPAGSYSASAYVSGEWIEHRFDVAGDTTVPELHGLREKVQSDFIRGTVTLGADRTKGIAEVSLEAIGRDGRSHGPFAVSGEDGTFTLTASSSDYWLGAISKDRALGSLMLVKKDASHVQVELEALGSATGVLLDEKGKPFAHARLMWTTPVEYSGGGAVGCLKNIYGGVTRTSHEGTFKVTGLLPGRRYRFSYRAETPEFDRGQHHFPEVRIHSAEAVDLGMLRVGAPTMQS